MTLDRNGFKRLSDDVSVDITYSPKYAAYQKAVHAAQIARTEKMVANGTLKKQRKNPNDPAAFPAAKTFSKKRLYHQNSYFRL